MSKLMHVYGVLFRILKWQNWSSECICHRKNQFFLFVSKWKNLKCHSTAFFRVRNTGNAVCRYFVFTAKHCHHIRNFFSGSLNHKGPMHSVGWRLTIVMHNRDNRSILSLRLHRVDIDWLKTDTCIELAELFTITSEASTSWDNTFTLQSTSVPAHGNEGNW
jgi:hypothetical protein